ncbi:MAG: PEGA domain-containing protein, partial [candidate division Zixibacteria bacterium]|nr:PEGA domain-containing protein [candidate division Zixibacteria bacterium]
HLQINVNVPEARVIFNEKFQGTATVGDPLNLVNLSTGKITVHLQARGYESIKREVVIRQNQWTQEIFQFQKKQLPDSTQYNQDSEGAGSKNPAEMCWDSAIGALTSCQ